MIEYKKYREVIEFKEVGEMTEYRKGKRGNYCKEGREKIERGENVGRG